MPYEKVGKNEPVCIADEVPFEIPESWEWVRLGSIGDWGSGATPSRSVPEYYGGDIPWLKTGDLNDSYIKYIPENISELALEKTSVRLNPTGSVLIAMYGATIGKVGILTFPATTNQACCACLPIEIFNEYLFYFLMSQKVAFVKQGEGGAQPNISKEKIVATLMPLPPLAEQYRIVAKIKELFPLVKKYKETYSAVSSLNNSFPDLLKKSILQEAVQGKLVPQDSSDEPASVLLERIRAEKERLIQEGKIKRDKHESVIYRRDNSHYEKRGSEEVCIDDELPFDIPSTWMWSRLSSIVTVLGDGIHGTPVYSANGTTAFINGNNLQDGKIVIKPDTKRVTDEEASKHKRCLTKDTVLLSINGTIGNVAFYDGEHVILGKSACYFNLLSGVSKEYVRLVLETDYFAKYAVSVATGTTIKNVPLAGMRNLLVPIPPTAEQAEIVQAVALALNLVAAL